LLCAGGKLGLNLDKKPKQPKENVELNPVLQKVLEVSPSGFYEWLKRPLSDREIEDQRQLELIRNSYAASRGVYDYRRVLLDLREIGKN